MSNRTVKIGLAGCGYVGGGLCVLLEKVGPAIEARHGVRLVVEKILVRDPARERKVSGVPLTVGKDRFTTDPAEVLESPEIDLVVEVIGGEDPAESFIRRAIAAGKPVVTANKAVIGKCGPELAERAERAGVPLGFEAAVCGAVPILSALRDGTAGDVVLSIEGIVNATCNFILGRVTAGLTYAEALEEARRAGYTEADPTLDIDGIDAAQKLAILVWTAFGEWVPWQRIPRAGVRDLPREAVLAAAGRGRVLRLVARAARDEEGVIRSSIGLLELDPADPLALVTGENNGIRVKLAGAGTLFFSGPGAGAVPTASAVLGDVVRAVLAQGRHVDEAVEEAIA